MKLERPPLHQADDVRELLLHSKATQTVTPAQRNELQRISKLDVSKYSEEDVRAEIIDPVIRILGYQKETYFSLQREKPLKVLGGDLCIDYNMTLWSEAYWIIEAKKVKRKTLKFISSELQQALKYAVHPEINAALVVLCDGRVFEVYDREESVNEPAARVEVSELAEQFHILQSLLAPWQTWFFQKRRVLRLLDRVLDHEINPGRLVEFKESLERRLERKRGRVIENWRNAHPISNDRRERDAALRSMSIKDLIEAEFFIGFTQADVNAMAKVLVEKARPGGFDVMFQMFPDHPRGMNDHFVGAALRTFIEFESQGLHLNWLPEWLGAKTTSGDSSDGIKRLIQLGLNSFDGDKGRKLVLQYSASSRRLAKLAMAFIPALAQTGQRNHELLRYSFEELHLAQYISTPTGHNIRMLDGIQAMMTSRLIEECQDDRKGFSTARAETMLQDSWEMERRLVGDGVAYWKGLAGRGIEGEMHPTECCWVDYDFLGHLVLCVVTTSSEKWSEYVVQAHESDLQRLARNGSWQARKLLGVASETPLPVESDKEMAERFFCGDIALFQNLRDAYKNRPRAR